MKIRPVLGVCSLGLCVLGQSTWAGELSHSELDTQVGYSYATAVESSNAAAVQFTPELNFRFDNQTSATVSARIRFDDRNSLLPGRPNRSNYTRASKPWAVNDNTLVELRDAFVDIPVKNGTLRLGKQQIVWGALDGVKVLDQLNPQSFEHFILEPFDESRIGLWSAYADITAVNWRIEMALIPDDTTHYIPDPDAWFEFAAPRFRFGQATADTLPVVQGNPEDTQGTAGIRLSRYVGGVDIQFVALSGLEFEPLGRLVTGANGIALETFHERRNLLGVSFETSLSAFALRGEISHAPDRVFNTRTATELDTQRLQHWRAGLGVDWNAPLGLFVNVQYLHDHVSKAPANLIRPTRERIATAFVRRQFLYETLSTELRWYGSLEDHDQLIRGLVRYSLSDTTSVSVSADLFEGHNRGVFGQFASRDQVTLTLQHTF